MFSPPHKFNNDPKFVGLAKSIFTDKLYENLNLKPLKFLESFDMQFSPLLKFHLRELYLRKNLSFHSNNGN